MPPRFEYGRPLPGRGGITVRYLRAQAPTAPGHGGRDRAPSPSTRVGERFTWQLRRVGEPRDPRAAAAARARASCASDAPGGKSGLYLFEVAHAHAPHGRRRSSCSRRQARDVLVVLPVTTWQGLNPADDDGDGRPDTLLGRAAGAARAPVRRATACPPQIRRHEALLLAQLDRKGRRYDLTTDVALGARRGAASSTATAA